MQKRQKTMRMRIKQKIKEKRKKKLIKLKAIEAKRSSGKLQAQGASSASLTAAKTAQKT